MKYWSGVVAVIAVAAGVMWIAKPDKPVAADQAGADGTTRQTRLSPRARSQPGSPAEQVEMESPSGEPIVMAEAAPAPLKPVALASLAEPPAGPELAPGLTPMTVMENMRTAFRNYSARFGGNPVGTNQEITRTLNGANPGNTPFLQTEDGLVTNERGELVDNWGTPYFFHQLSRTEIEIQSAGPDRKMWTSDDLVMK